jgi:hypothetical protein
MPVSAVPLYQFCENLYKSLSFSTYSAKMSISSTAAFHDAVHAQAVLTADPMHRDAGLWAFDSLNANAYSTAKSYLERSSADFACIQ